MRLIVLEPGHFHATLLQKQMYEGVEGRASVYARLGADALEYLRRLSLFETRWELDVHLSDDPVGEMVRDRAGDVMVLAGRNRGKIDRILAALSAGLHVLADKPWIIVPEDLPKLERALAMADEKGLIAYDIMTERYEVTSEIQRALVRDAEIFGELEAVNARSVHNVMKVVAGVPLQRPAWFFDIAEYGDALADVGTHVVDLVQWTAFPEQAVRVEDIRILERRNWPLVLSREQYRQVTGETLKEERLEYYCNNSVQYTLRGVPVNLEITWEWQGPSDVYEASFRGTRSTIEVRQQGGPPEVHVVTRHPEVLEAVRRKGFQLEDGRVTIADELRVGHEAHFGQVARRFFEYVKTPGALPAWERPYMMAKYFVSTGRAG